MAVSVTLKSFPQQAAENTFLIGLIAIFYSGLQPSFSHHPCSQHLLNLSMTERSLRTRSFQETVYGSFSYSQEFCQKTAENTFLIGLIAIFYAGLEPSFPHHPYSQHLFNLSMTEADHALMSTPKARLEGLLKEIRRNSRKKYLFISDFVRYD